MKGVASEPIINLATVILLVTPLSSCPGTSKYYEKLQDFGKPESSACVWGSGSLNDYEYCGPILLTELSCHIPEVQLIQNDVCNYSGGLYLSPLRTPLARMC